MYDIFVQGIGVAALICSTMSFQQKKRTRLLIMQMMASLLSALQLFLLGAYSGACLDVIAFIRSLVFSRGKTVMKVNVSTWRIIFIAEMILAGLLTWTEIYALLAVVAGCLSTIALSMKSQKKIRILLLFVAPCWIVYNVVYGAYAGVLNECIAFISIVIGIFRYDVKQKKPEETSLEIPD